MRARAPYVDVVLGTHNVHRAAELLAEARAGGPITEIWDEAVTDDHVLFPSALPARRDDLLQRLAHDPDRLRQQLRLLHRAGRSGPGGQPALRRHRRRDPQPRRRRGHRGHPARPERQLLRPRPHAGGSPRRRLVGTACGRCSPTCCGPSAACRASGGSASPAPIRRTCGPRRSMAMAETPAVCEQLHLPLQAGSDRVLAAMHRGYTAERYLERLAAARAAIADLGRHHRPHRRLPRRDRRRLRPHPRGGRRRRVRLGLHLHLLVAPGHRGGRLHRPLRRRRHLRRALRAAPGRRRAQRPGPSPGPHRPRRGRAGRGPQQEGPGRHDAAAPARASSCTSARPDPLRPGTYADVEITDAAPHHLLGRFVEVTAGPDPSHPHPGGGRLSLRAPRRHAGGAVRPRRGGRGPDGLGQVRGGDGRRPGRGRHRDRGRRRLPGVPRHGHRHGQATPAEQAEVVHHGIDLADPAEEVTRRALPPGLRRRRWPASPSAATVALLVGGTGLYVSAVIDRLEPPGAWPEVRAELEAEPDTAVLLERLRAPRPGRRRQDGAVQPAPRRAGPRGLPRQRPAVQHLRARPRRLPRHRRRADRAALAPGPADAAASSDRFDAVPGRRLPRRGRAGWRPGPAGSPAPLARPSATPSCSTCWRVAATLEEAIERAVARTRRFAVRQERWFRRDPRVHWIDIDDDPLVAVPHVLGALTACV